MPPPYNPTPTCNLSNAVSVWGPTEVTSLLNGLVGVLNLKGIKLPSENFLVLNSLNSLVTLHSNAQESLQTTTETL